MQLTLICRVKLKKTLFLPLTITSHLNLIYRNKVTEDLILSNKVYVNVMSNTLGIVAVKLRGEADLISHLSSFQHSIWLPLHLPPVMCSLHLPTHLLHIALNRTKKWES